MGNIRNRTTSATSPEAQRAQQRVDELNSQLKDLAIEGAKLAASSSPVGGQIVDVASGLSNIAAGNYWSAVLDGVGLIPFGGDAVKGAIKGTRIVKAVNRARSSLKTAQAALTRAKAFARTRTAAKSYWNAIRAKRNAIIQKYKDCKTAACAKKRDAELRKVSRLPATGGKWVDAKGNPVPAGQGLWKPDPGTSLHTALARHGTPVKGVPFVDGKPDFTGFPPKGMERTPRVEIDMKGDSSDFTAASRALRDKGGPDTRKLDSGTWHHEPDGVTMSYVDRDVHTAYKKADGTPNSGTPHAGGDSMVNSAEF